MAVVPSWVERKEQKIASKSLQLSDIYESQTQAILIAQ